MAEYQVESDGIKGKFYTVDTSAKTCTCKFFEFRGACKHLKNMLDTEGDSGHDSCCSIPISTSKIEMKKFNNSNQAKVLKDFDLWTRQRVSKNFILRDFLYSSTSDYFGVSNKPSDHPEQVFKSAVSLANQILEPVLEKFGRFFITFGYSSRRVMDVMYPTNNPKSSNPHHWDRGTYGDKVFARIDIVPLCVLDGEVSPEDFLNWVMDNTDVDLLMFWRKSSTFCIDISPKPRRVAIEWVSQGKGENGGNKITHRGWDYWNNIYPTLPEDKKPKFSPSVTNGSMFYNQGGF